MRFPLHPISLAQIEIEVVFVKSSIRSPKFSTLTHFILGKSALKISHVRLRRLWRMIFAINISPLDSTKIYSWSGWFGTRNLGILGKCLRSSIFTLVTLCGKRGSMFARVQSSFNAYSFPSQRMVLETTFPCSDSSKMLHRDGSLSEHSMSVWHPCMMWKIPSGSVGVEKKMQSRPRKPIFLLGRRTHFLMKGLKRNPVSFFLVDINISQPWEDETQWRWDIGVSHLGIGILYIFFSVKLNNSMLELPRRKTRKGSRETGRWRLCAWAVYHERQTEPKRRRSGRIRRSKINSRRHCGRFDQLLASFISIVKQTRFLAKPVGIKKIKKIKCYW